jgi:endonuclease YncB( thermonuclease family)
MRIFWCRHLLPNTLTFAGTLLVKDEILQSTKFTVLVLNIFIFVFLCFASPVLSQSLTGVASVIDGDTLEIRGTRLRLHGIDAPESRQLCQRSTGEQWRCGQRAALALDEFIRSRQVSCVANTIDRYNRLVAVCRVGGIDINRWMVRQGWAMAYLQYSNDYATDQLVAMRSKKNIWSGFIQEPWEWRKESTAQPDKSQHHDFCYITQMWLPMVLEQMQVSGQGICKAGGGEFCGSVTSIGQGICKAGGGEFCGSVTNIGQGICKAGGGEFCGTSVSLEAAVCSELGTCQTTQLGDVLASVLDACGTQVLSFGISR